MDPKCIRLRLSMTPERRDPARQVTLQSDRAERELGAPSASWPGGPARRGGMLLTSAATGCGRFMRAMLPSIYFVHLRHDFLVPAAPVAQICNLLYRRLVVGRAPCGAARSERSDAPQIANLRYSRVQLCVTLVAAPPPWEISSQRRVHIWPLRGRGRRDACPTLMPRRLTGTWRGTQGEQAHGAGIKITWPILSLFQFTPSLACSICFWVTLIPCLRSAARIPASVSLSRIV